MAIEVRIPTILRTYTGGERAVESSGSSVAELIDTLESAHPGIKERLVEDGADGPAVRRFVNIYVDDEDIRFTGALATELSDSSTVVILPAVAGGSAHLAAQGPARSAHLAAQGPAPLPA